MLALTRKMRQPVDIEISRETLQQLLDSGETPVLSLWVYEAEKDNKGNLHVSIAFNDPKKFFKIERRERKYKQVKELSK